MLLNYRLDKIKSLLIDFSNITGQRVGLFDADFNEIYITTDHCSFCSMIRNTKKGLARCLESDHAAIEQAAKQRKLIIYRCHAGIVEACAPIYDDNELLGFIFLGQMLYKNKYKEQCANIELLAGDIIEDVAVLRQAVSLIKSLDKEYLVSAANVMLACTRFIIYEQLLKYEKSDVWFKINDYIKNNFNKNISLESISDALSISVPTLCNTTKKQSGKTVVQIITDVRIEKSKYYLENSEYTVAEIARKVGFDDYSYFSRVFKKYTGYSPRNWKKTIDKINI